MENFRNERYIAEAGDFLNGVDHEANEKLNKEIADLRSEDAGLKLEKRPILHTTTLIILKIHMTIWSEAMQN